MGSSEPFHNSPDLQKPLDQFRAKTNRLKLHPAEMQVLGVVSAHLTFLPWALGGMRPWAHWISLTLAAVGFALALVPRNYTEEHTGSDRFRLVMWPKLVRFPIFWIGAAILSLVVIQGLNPAWAFVTDGVGFWMKHVDHIHWLPAGVTAPFERWNPWRVLVVYSSVWLTVCTVWVAFTRRRTVQLLIMIIAANGLCLGLFGIAQRIIGNGKIFWFFDSPNASFFGSFIYKNHGGAYLLLPLALSCGLAGWYYLRGLRRLEKSNPSGVLAFAATCIAISILASYARGATITTLVFLLLVISAFLWHQMRLPSESRKPIVAVALVLVFGYFLKSGLEAVNTREAWDRLKHGLTRQDNAIESRQRVTAASIEMLGENWKRGVGAGSFRYLFPTYQHRHPELLGPNRRFWEHAHNDVVQVPIELGIFGSLLVISGLAYWIVKLIRTTFWENPVSVCAATGAILLMGYSWIDFPFQCPSILLTWCILWPVAAIWARLEESGARS